MPFQVAEHGVNIIETKERVEVVVAFHGATSFRFAATLVLDSPYDGATAIVENGEYEEREGHSEHLDDTSFLWCFSNRMTWGTQVA